MIRKVLPNDREGVCELIELFFNEHLIQRGYTFDYQKALYDFDAYVNNPCIAGLVIDNNSRIDGFIGGFINEKLWLSGKTLSELMWYVRPEKRREGLKLLQSFEELAKSCGCDDIMMIGLEGTPVGGIYERLGYTKQESMYYKKVGG